ncbi:MAG: hypothetical protein IPG43_01510 [Proteobacteria bacterium]|nr:hypothetical protein [Pseudomonadota bacterium]
MGKPHEVGAGGKLHRHARVVRGIARHLVAAEQARRALAEHQACVAAAIGERQILELGAGRTARDVKPGRLAAQHGGQQPAVGIAPQRQLGPGAAENMGMPAGAYLEPREQLTAALIEGRHQHLVAGQQRRQQHIVGRHLAEQGGGGDRALEQRLGRGHRAELMTHGQHCGDRRAEATAIVRHHEACPAELGHGLPVRAIEGRAGAAQRAQARTRQGARAEIGGAVGHELRHVLVGVVVGLGGSGLVHAGMLRVGRRPRHRGDARADAAAVKTGI